MKNDGKVNFKIFWLFITLFLIIVSFLALSITISDPKLLTFNIVLIQIILLMIVIYLCNEISNK